MLPPGALVMLSPVVVGVLFGTRTLAGLLAGALVSGVQMAVSMSNTGGAYDNCKKYIEAGIAIPASSRVAAQLHSDLSGISDLCTALGLVGWHG